MLATSLACTLAWLRVSGGNSVLAPWVTHQFQEVGNLVEFFRDTPCGEVSCSYYKTIHNLRHELKRNFGFHGFRCEAPGHSA